MIYIIGNVQKYIFGDTAIVSIEIAVVPLKFGVGSLFSVHPVVIGANGNYVFTLLHIWSQVESHCHYAIFVSAQIMTVEIEVSTLTYSFELDKYFLVTFQFRNPETFAIPHHCVCQLFDGEFKCFIFIESMRQSYLLPFTVVEFSVFGFRKFSYLQLPFTVEVVFFAFGRLTVDNRQCDQQKNEKI